MRESSPPLNQTQQICALSSAVGQAILPSPSPAPPLSLSGLIESTQLVNPTATPATSVAITVPARLFFLDTQEVFDLTDITEIAIGRHPNCRIFLPDQSVSSVHCRVYRDKYSFIIKDSSSNGTFLNGKRMQREQVSRLMDGDAFGLVQGDMSKYAFVFLDQQSVIRAETEGSSRLIVAGTEGASPDAPGVKSAGTGTRTGLVAFDKRFAIARLIGKGNFSEVFQAIERVTGKSFAVKVVDTAKTELFMKKARSSTIDLESEYRMLASVSHPNIVQFETMYRQENKLYLVTEYMDGGDLLMRLMAKGRYEEKAARYLFKQIAEGLRYLHEEKNIFIRDVKPENILLRKGRLSQEEDIPKLADLGLARELRTENAKTYAGTPHYFAPEMYRLMRGQVKSYGKEVDIWSLGVVLYVVLSARPAFSDDNLEQQVTNGLYDFEGEEWQGVSDLAKDLVTQCMQVDPAKRLTIGEVLEHPWLSETQSTASEEPPKKRARRVEEVENQKIEN